jgi:hypothetical protein
MGRDICETRPSDYTIADDDSNNNNNNNSNLQRGGGKYVEKNPIACHSRSFIETLHINNRHRRIKKDADLMYEGGGAISDLT